MLINKAQIKEFSLAADTDPKTVFQLGFIDPLIATRLIDSNMEVKRPTETEEARTVFHTDEQLLLFALCGIKGWSNFKDELPFQVEEKVLFGIKTFMVKADLLYPKYLSLNEILEIGMAVKDLVTLGVEEIKN
jgi:hypothetical protein